MKSKIKYFGIITMYNNIVYSVLTINYQLVILSEKSRFVYITY